MRVEIKTVTPEFANELLGQNELNRKVNKAQLDMLCRTIESGKWRLTHQGVAIYNTGELADGQHRLMAIAKTGIACKMPVFYGVEKDADSIMAIDCGRMRTVTDSSKLTGQAIKPQDSAILTGLEFGFKVQRPKLTHFEMMDLSKKYQDELVISNDILSRTFKGVSIAPVKVAIVECVSNGDCSKEFAYKFYNTLITGEYDEKILLNAVRLRNKLLSQNYNGGYDRDTAYNFTKRLLVNSYKGIEIKRIK